MLGNRGSITESNWDEVLKSRLPGGQALSSPQVLFRKVEDAEVSAEIEKLGKRAGMDTKEKEEVHAEPLKEKIQFDEFKKIDLRVALIKQAERVPVEKALKLQVDLGFEQRTIVSGIALAYEPEQLIGKKVVVIANLSLGIHHGNREPGDGSGSGERRCVGAAGGFSPSAGQCNFLTRFGFRG